MGIHRSGVRIAAVPPDILQQPFPALHPAGASGKDGEQFELRQGQRYLLISDGNAMPLRIYAEQTVADYLLLQ